MGTTKVSTNRGKDEDDSDNQWEDREGVQQVAKVWHSLGFCDPHRWVLDKREHGRSAIGNGVLRDTSVCFCCVSGHPPRHLNVWVSVFFVVGAPGAGGVECQEPGLRDALTLRWRML